MKFRDWEINADKYGNVQLTRGPLRHAAATWKTAIGFMCETELVLHRGPLWVAVVELAEFLNDLSVLLAREMPV